MPARVEGHFAAQFVHERRTLRTRANKAHVAAYDVEELWQLIDSRQPQEFPHPRNAVVVFLRPSRDAIHLRISAHAPKFEDLEYFPGLADSFLAIENRPAGFKPDSNSCREYQWKGNQQHGAAH